jgi:hypothetical protein
MLKVQIQKDERKSLRRSWADIRTEFQWSLKDQSQSMFCRTWNNPSISDNPNPSRFLIPDDFSYQQF